MSHIAVIVKSDHCQKGYWVFGNRNIGFGVKIVWQETGRPLAFSQTCCIFPSREAALLFLRQLIRGDVHPVHLRDIARDYLLEKHHVACPIFSD